MENLIIQMIKMTILPIKRMKWKKMLRRVNEKERKKDR